MSQQKENGQPAARSYSGRLLRVDLTRRTLAVEALDDLLYRRYLGGWGFLGHTLLREVPPGADPLGPANRLVFATGVLTGLPASGLARHAVGAKSPLTGGFGGSEVGGFWGAELKRAGFDALIIQGQADRPVYLWIHDGEAEIRDAGHLWGLKTKECQERLREELEDPRVRVAQIGIGGENLVRYACVMNDLKDAAGRGGLGAVMGSKRLKAIAVRGSGKITARDPKAIQEMAKWMSTHVAELSPGHHSVGTGGAMPAFEATGNLPVRNFRDGGFPIDKISATTIRNTVSIGMEGCYACAVRCKKVVQLDAPYPVDPAYGGPEYETLGALGSCCGIDDLAVLCKASELCNAYTVDTISAGVTIAFAMECFERGLLTLDDTGGLDLRFGNGEALLAAIEQIARREGFGARLAEGSRRLAQEVGNGSQAFAMEVKGQEYPMHEPRLKRALAIGYAVSPTGADHNHSLHDMGLEKEGALLEKNRELGALEPIPLEDLGPAKVRVSWYNTLDQMAQNCAPTCNFVNWTFQQRSDLVRAATGWNFTLWEWLKAGERALALARLFNAREGFTAADDWLPARSFQPATSGALAETAVEPEKLSHALGLLYGMADWDPQVACPTAARLEELDLGWAVDYLPTTLRR
ncbi:MAG: aldehyde ferredoxin oxidoreductase family protein [Chloroflexi bacterium]|nr:aldehyde ferredoxin oxidoreductase family protein [Chloroflexota bacterium]